MWQVALVLKKYQKTTITSSLKYFQIVVETFPITYNGIIHVESLYNTLFYNNYKIKFIKCTGCIGVEEIPKNVPII
jgi:hypothetical protein